MDAKIKIEKDVPIVPTGARGRPCKYPWHEMEVGDSFAWPSDVSRQAAYKAAQDASRATGSQFRAHNTKDGIRIWRIA